MSFVSATFLNSLSSVTQETADAQNYGVIKVDPQGTVLLYNQYQADLDGMDTSAAEGRSYFTQIAPCTNNRLFFGKFREGLSAGELDETFRYTFTFKMKPTPVDIHLYHDKASKTNWVFVKKAA